MASMSPANPHWYWPGGIRPLDALAEFVGGPTDQNHDICGFALRHTLASHGCCSRGKPGGR